MTLGNAIARRIIESSDYRITFAEYMSLALYHPQHGYYATSPRRIGAAGDFFTSPHLGADFGQLLAEQFVQMWQILQPPHPFTLVEMGAGQGLLAADILRYLAQKYPEFSSGLQYIIIERAAALVEEQKRQLNCLGDMGAEVRWCQFEDISPDSITGCFFSNELVDALPVHQITVAEEQLKEVYVSLAAGSRDAPEDGYPQFIEVTADLSTPRLAEYFNLVGIDLRPPQYPTGYRSDVNLAALDWIADVARRLRQGYVLTIDYGYPSDRYYSPARSQGTLQCYYRHAHHSNPYIYVGQQDITAHVDFTALQKQGDQCGLEFVGLTKQGLFLMALGLGNRLAALSQSNSTDPSEIQAKLRDREALHTLINPIGLGNFGVLVQSKGVEQSQPLTGLMGELN
ncbi:MAG: class I SAM-dependent methyltransferase [Leptolyngbyaceae cyanobacterium RU_5_1]|nr:class I SAM-dependent methyltransferase [Leptolyngbyaceae cyanobacterium RU_5_1]